MAVPSHVTPSPVIVHPVRPRQAGNPPAQGGNPPAQGGGNPPAQGGGNPPAQGGGNPPAQGGGNPNSQSSGSSSQSNSNSNSQSASNSNSQSGSNAPASSTPAPISIPQTAPAGGVQFTRPAQTAAASYYKIAPSELITFGWNLTSLSITPDSLTISAFCSANGNTYPVGPTNGVIPGDSTQVVWNPFAYQQANPTQPLIIASYTLQVMDAHGLTQVPAPGRFAPNTEMTFALYTPQSYTPLASWTCSGCSSAASNALTHPIFLSLFATLIAMLLGGFGTLRRR
ncbi:hypothetical protein K439DRAFT_1416093 [Ramaria rubella]|nr:hypothetical protein K439DRAFT_1416093 [Ramaria rubella]